MNEVERNNSYDKACRDPKESLFERAEKGDTSVLNDPKVSKVENS